MDILEDKVKGVLFGNAIGDAIGLGTEFMGKATIKVLYPTRLREYSEIYQDKHRNRWKAGEWTDDTDQMMCILESLLAQRKVDIYDIAERIYQWAYTDGRGTGKTILTALRNPNFLQNPHAVAEEIWLQSNRENAANGAIMRTSVLGIWQYQDLEVVRRNTEYAAKITHFDPRCVGSCVVLTTTISRILQGETNIASLFQEAIKVGEQYDARIAPYLQDAYTQPLTHLQLDERASIGYTLKALACAFWALRQDNFELAIDDIIHEGGDADTNAAVAGALLGAKLGYEQLPTRWRDKLAKGELLRKKAEELRALLG